MFIKFTPGLGDVGIALFDLLILAGGLVGSSLFSFLSVVRFSFARQHLLGTVGDCSERSPTVSGIGGLSCVF